MEKRKLTRKQKKRRRCRRIMAEYGLPENLFIGGYRSLFPHPLKCSFNGGHFTNYEKHINSPAKLKEILRYATDYGENLPVHFVDDDIKLEGLLGFREYLLIKDLAGI